VDGSNLAKLIRIKEKARGGRLLLFRLIAFILEVDQEAIAGQILPHNSKDL
jgi:hypothetical protein